MISAVIGSISAAIASSSSRSSCARRPSSRARPSSCVSYCFDDRRARAHVRPAFRSLALVDGASLERRRQSKPARSAERPMRCSGASARLRRRRLVAAGDSADTPVNRALTISISFAGNVVSVAGSVPLVEGFADFGCRIAVVRDRQARSSARVARVVLAPELNRRRDLRPAAQRVARRDAPSRRKALRYGRVVRSSRSDRSTGRSVVRNAAAASNPRARKNSRMQRHDDAPHAEFVRRPRTRAAGRRRRKPPDVNRADRARARP